MYQVITTIEEYEDILNFTANHSDEIIIYSLEKYNNEIIVRLEKTLSATIYPNQIDNSTLNFLAKKVYEYRKKNNKK